MLADLAARAMFVAAARMGGEGLNEVEGRLMKMRSAPWMADWMAGRSEKSADMCSTRDGGMSGGRVAGVRDIATTVFPERAAWCT